MNSGAKIVQTERKTASLLACFAEVPPIFAAVLAKIVQKRACSVKNHEKKQALLGQLNRIPYFC